MFTFIVIPHHTHPPSYPHHLFPHTLPHASKFTALSFCPYNTKTYDHQTFKTIGYLYLFQIFWQWKGTIYTFGLFPFTHYISVFSPCCMWHDDNFFTDCTFLRCWAAFRLGLLGEMFLTFYYIDLQFIHISIWWMSKSQIARPQCPHSSFSPSELRRPYSFLPNAIACHCTLTLHILLCTLLYCASSHSAFFQCPRTLTLISLDFHILTLLPFPHILQIH